MQSTEKIYRHLRTSAIRLPGIFRVFGRPRNRFDLIKPRHCCKNSPSHCRGRKKNWEKRTMISISKIKARPILDSRGEWTIETLLTLSDGKKFSASVPKGRSTGSYEARTVSVAVAIRA